MTHIIPPVSQDFQIFLVSASGAASGSSEAATATSHFLISPWLGLIILSVMVITGAIAVIREIQIEEDD